MAFKRTKDLAVRVGTYNNKSGETKNKYVQVGTQMEDEDGKKFLLIDPTFNFAGVKLDDGKNKVLVSMFDPKPKEEAPKNNEDISWME